MTLENASLGMSAVAYHGDELIETPPDNAKIEAVTWNVAGPIQDLSQANSVETDDITARDNDGIVSVVATLINVDINFGMRYDKVDETYLALETAFKTRAPISLLIMDSDREVVGAKGFGANFVITGFEQTQNLREAIKVSVTAAPQSAGFFYTKAGS